MFGNVVLEIPKDAFEHEFEAVKSARGAKIDTDLDENALREVVERYKGVVQRRTGKSFPQDPRQQLTMSRDAVFRSWMNARAIEYRRIYDIPDHIGTAVNVQMMVFGNTGERSATGVGFTRNPATGKKEFYGEFLINAQGEDVVSGVRTPQPIVELEQVLPKAYKQLREITTQARAALQGRAGFRVHHPGRTPVHAADAQRQAHRLRRGDDCHRPGGREARHAEGGDPAGRSRGAQSAAGAGIRHRGVGEDPDGRRPGCRHRRGRPADTSCSRPRPPSSGPSRASPSSSCVARPCPTTFTACSCRRGF